MLMIIKVVSEITPEPSQESSVEIKTSYSRCVAVRQKNAGGENEGKSGDVVENTWRKNVRKRLSRDVDEKERVKITLWRC